VGDELDVAFRVDFSLELRHQIQQVDAFDLVRGMQCRPGFLERRGRLKMPAAGCHCCDENAHVICPVIVSARLDRNRSVGGTNADRA
jgi:hypothetical protein